MFGVQTLPVFHGLIGCFGALQDSLSAVTSPPPFLIVTKRKTGMKASLSRSCPRPNFRCSIFGQKAASSFDTEKKSYLIEVKLRREQGLGSKIYAFAISLMARSQGGFPPFIKEGFVKALRWMEPF